MEIINSEIYIIILITFNLLKFSGNSSPSTLLVIYNPLNYLFYFHLHIRKLKSSKLKLFTQDYTICHHLSPYLDMCLSDFKFNTFNITLSQDLIMFKHVKTNHTLFEQLFWFRLKMIISIYESIICGREKISFLRIIPFCVNNCVMMTYNMHNKAIYLLIHYRKYSDIQ